MIYKKEDYQVGDLLQVDVSFKFYFYVENDILKDKLYIIQNVKNYKNNVNFVVEIIDENNYLSIYHPEYFLPPIKSKAGNILYGVNNE